MRFPTTIIEELFSKNQRYKAVLYQHAPQVIRIVIFRWMSGTVPGYGSVSAPYWESIDGLIWTDTLEQARLLATQELQR